MKILIISQYYEPDITAAAFRISETVSYLRAKRHVVKVITTYPHKSTDKKYAYPDLDEQDVYRCNMPSTEGKGFIGYLYSYLTFMCKSIWTGLKIRNYWYPDVIWASSPPMFVGISGYILSKLFNCPWVLDVRDVWPDSAVAAGQLSENSLAYAIASRLESLLYKKADAVSCVAQPMKRYLEQYTSRTVQVVYNGVNVNGWQEIGSSLGVKVRKSVKTIMYAGNLGHVQQLDLLIKAFHKALERGLSPIWQLVFLGDGTQKENLIRLSTLLKVDGSVKFLQPVSKEEAMNHMAASDLLYLSLKPDEVLKMTIPSKVFDYMLLNRPIIAGIFGEGREILQKSGMNYIFDPGNKEMLVNLLLTIDTKYEHGIAKTSNRKLIEHKFSRESQVNRLEEVLLSCFEN